MTDLEARLMERLRQEATGCHAWSNGPGYVYAEHAHPYEKILYCVAGSISFTLPDRAIHLRPGDRMVLPPGTIHGAVVGPEGVTCIEGRGGKMQAR